MPGDSSLCGRHPSVCDGSYSSIELDFRGEAIDGYLPTQLGLLTNVRRLGGVNNALSGTLPTELARLTLLAQLQLDENSISGTLPTQIVPANLSAALIGLTLSNNRLSGSLPPSWSGMHVRVLDLLRGAQLVAKHTHRLRVLARYV